MANKLNVKLRGKGSYGYVYRVIDRNKKFTYAEKHLYVDDTTSKEKKRFIKEFNIMKNIHMKILLKHIQSIKLIISILWSIVILLYITI